MSRVAPVLARLLTDRLVRALGGVDQIEAFGKAPILGTAGEIDVADLINDNVFALDRPDADRASGDVAVFIKVDRA